MMSKKSNCVRIPWFSFLQKTKTEVKEIITLPVFLYGQETGPLT
jgi:hypothetical protein